MVGKELQYPELNPASQSIKEWSWGTLKLNEVNMLSKIQIYFCSSYVRGCMECFISYPKKFGKDKLAVFSVKIQVKPKNL